MSWVTLFSSLKWYSLWLRFPLLVSIFSCDILARYVDTVLNPILPYTFSYCLFTSSEENQALGYSNLRNISNLSFIDRVPDPLMLLVIIGCDGTCEFFPATEIINFVADIMGNSPSNSASAFVPSSLAMRTCISSA